MYQALGDNLMDYTETVHCPRCGRFVTKLRAYGTCESLKTVWALCSRCGQVRDPKRVVDGFEVGWGWDDFFT